MKSRYHTVLTIAGSDSGGGAGIQADIKTISACGCYASSTITAITAQNTTGVLDIFGIPPQIVGSQIDAVLSDIGADAVKIGMLHDSELILIIREKLLKWDIRNIILDPVMVSTSGHRLIAENAISVLCKELLPITRIITPNLPEAEILLKRKIYSQEELPECAEELSKRYSTYREADGSTRKVSVFLKAGHFSDEKVVDVFYNAVSGNTTFLTGTRRHTRNTHGTGCTLSSALASFIACGNTPEDAARKAKEYLDGAIESGADYEIGHGFGPVNHFWKR